MTQALIRSPFYVLPITIMAKAREQKAYRQIHCIECGMPISSITDQIVTIFDGSTPIEQLSANKSVHDLWCSRHICKQRYRLEVAL